MPMCMYVVPLKVSRLVYTACYIYQGGIPCVGNRTKGGDGVEMTLDCERRAVCLVVSDMMNWFGESCKDDEKQTGIRGLQCH